MVPLAATPSIQLLNFDVSQLVSVGAYAVESDEQFLNVLENEDVETDVSPRRSGVEVIEEHPLNVL